MIQVVEERSGKKNTQIQESQQEQQYEFDNVQFRIWEEGKTYKLYQKLHSSIVKKQSNCNTNCGKISNGVPKKYMCKIKTMKMGKSKKLCSICCNEFQKDELIMQLPCKHIYHEKCCKSWLQNSTKCPNCRLDVLDALKNEEN